MVPRGGDRYFSRKRKRETKQRDGGRREEGKEKDERGGERKVRGEFSRWR